MRSDLAISVRGPASAEEVAAVIVVVGHGERQGWTGVDPLSEWRAGRLAAVRRGTSSQL